MKTTTAPLSCRKCHCTHVRWERRQDGSWYLAFRFPPTEGDREAMAYAAAARKRPHACGDCPRCKAEADSAARRAAWITEEERRARVLELSDRLGEIIASDGSQDEAHAIIRELRELRKV